MSIKTVRWPNKIIKEKKKKGNVNNRKTKLLQFHFCVAANWVTGSVFRRDGEMLAKCSGK